MDNDDLRVELLRAHERTDARIEGLRADLNGRLRTLEQFKSKVEGAVWGTRALPAIVALITASAAWVAVLR